MRYVVGLVFFAFGTALLFSALARRRRVIAAGPGAQPPLHPSLRTLADTMPPLIVLALGIVGAKMALAFVVADATRHLSYLDLGGFLFLLAAYGTWVVIRSRYREVPARRPDHVEAR